MSSLLQFLIALFLAYLFLCAYLFVTQRSAMYFPDSQDFWQCPHFSEEQKIQAGNTRLYFVKRSDAAGVVYHGNAGGACGRTYWDAFFAAHNMSTVLVEYAGYGKDDGKPSQEALEQNVIDTGAFLKEQGFTKVVVAGESLGCSLASYHASKFPVDRVLLVSPFSSMAKLAQEKYRIFPVRWLLRDRYQTLAHLTDIKTPVTLIHGEADKIIPARHSQEIYDALPGEKKLVLVPRSGHNDVLSSKKAEQTIHKVLQK